MIIIPSILDGFRTLQDRTLKLTFCTNEPTPEQFMGIGQSIQQFGYLAFKSSPLKEAEKKAIEQLESNYDENTKSHSQRLRSVLFVCFNNDNMGYQDFQSYYARRMEDFITMCKSELP